METFEFTLVISGDVMSDEAINALFEAGCDDATFGGVDTSSFGGFNREAETLEQAIASAIAQVESVPGLVVRRVEPDDLVTLSEIAKGPSRNNARE
jgi:hypothetical protein